MFDQLASAAMPFQISLTYGAILAIIFVGLSFYVAITRGTKGIPFGAGEGDELMPAMRAQQNFAEYVPLALILLAGLEASGADDTWLRILGGSLVVVRLAHAWGLISGQIIGRGIGALGTLVILLAEGVWGLMIVL